MEWRVHICKNHVHISEIKNELIVDALIVSQQNKTQTWKTRNETRCNAIDAISVYVDAMQVMVFREELRFDDL